MIARPDKAKVKFLGTYIKSDPKGHTSKHKSGHAKRATLARTGAGTIRLEAPIMELMGKLVEDGFAKKGSFKGKARRDLIPRQEWEIVMYYNSVLGEVLNYYSFAANRSKMSRMVYTLQRSLMHTLASSRRCSTRQVLKKGNGKITALKTTKDSIRQVNFNGYGNNLSLKVNQKAFNVSGKGLDPEKLYLKRINQRTRSKLGCHCAICGKPDDIEMHHVRHTRKMGQEAKGFSKVMAQINRKQIPVCRDCHMKVYDGKYDGMKLSELV
ncbi:group II intron reverse transcriptase/maturase [Endozoicomonas sp. 2B-B]